ncbi:MAG: hypothetical protein DWQ34_09385 [Planctomycetota bacterium]|nr:MAG: hypothetical protein DWQ29_07510 [Planctomycetota bacterium]REJ94018.1 MAG: hypothetical protein DWQ34_09385 [Planctomycetota bacterium]REK21992.1 MAG: hypothetical protein DWQ41_19960 [Planctomycetota bacterium]REK31260.1 MAG: hypothetical protein DWQ45_19800 [Planctomycetota bacterium]
MSNRCPADRRAGGNSRRAALTLPEALLALCLLAWVVVSPTTFVLSVFCLAVVVLWSLASLRAPRATFSATAILLLGFALIAPLPGRLLQSREQARQNVARDHLRKAALAVENRLMNAPARRAEPTRETRR